MSFVCFSHILQINFEDTCKGFLEVAKVPDPMRITFPTVFCGLFILILTHKLIVFMFVYAQVYNISHIDARKLCILLSVSFLRILECKSYLSSFIRKVIFLLYIIIFCKLCSICIVVSSKNILFKIVRMHKR